MGTTSNSSTSRAPLSHAGDGARRYDVAILGGGASGLAAAISAARAGARAAIIESDVEAGLGLLATGNGRCNISNSKLAARRFLHEDAAREVLGRSPEADIKDFFEGLGLMLAEEDEGRLYPITRRAESVRDVLTGACARLGVDVLTGAECVEAHRDAASGTWELALSEPESPLSFKRGRDAKAAIRNARKALAIAPRRQRGLSAQRLVIAVGGASQSTCEALGVPHLEERPVLCPIGCAPALGAGPDPADALEGLDGLRVEAMLTLVRNGAAIAFEQGEILFRPYGISGIAAFNLSRRVLHGDVIELDLFPRLSEASLLELLARRTEAMGPFDGGKTWFDGMLARPLGALIAHCISGQAEPLARAAALLHRLPFSVSGTAEHAQAHVRRGGIPLSAIDLSTCSLVAGDDAPLAGLHACGEALDMDADCGGYNLAWAWLTGIRAGTAAAKGAIC